MARRKNKNLRRDTATPQQLQQVALLIGGGDLCVPGYTPLDKNPEIIAGCRRIASLLASTTIHLNANTDAGDVRIQNELSRLVDIDPMPNMTRATWMEASS